MMRLISELDQAWAFGLGLNRARSERLRCLNGEAVFYLERSTSVYVE